MDAGEDRLGDSCGAQGRQALIQAPAGPEQAHIPRVGGQGGRQGLTIQLKVVAGDGDGRPGVGPDGRQGPSRRLPAIGQARDGGL